MFSRDCSAKEQSLFCYKKFQEWVFGHWCTYFGHIGIII